MGYSVTNSDRLAMIEVLNLTWNMTLKSTQERGETKYTKWIIQAPNPKDKTYYTADGSSISEAINKWFLQIEDVNGVPIEREVWTSLWDSKMDLIKEEE